MALRLLFTVAPLLTGCYAIHTNVNIHSNTVTDSFADSNMDSYLYTFNFVTFASSGQLSVVETLGTGAGDPALPEWCKNDTQLNWKQRKERMQQHETLDWAKKAMKKMIEYNETVPEWMRKMVNDDQKRGQMKWAVQEARRLQADNKSIPEWMADFVVEDTKWANRWAACKAAELRHQGTEVPTWMVENSRKGIVEYATEKAQLIEEQIDELEEEKMQETALADSRGNAQLARKRTLVMGKESKTWTISQQTVFLQQSLEELEAAQDEAKEAGYKGYEVTLRLKKAIKKAQDDSDMLTRILNRKAQVVNFEALHGKGIMAD